MKWKLFANIVKTVGPMVIGIVAPKLVPVTGEIINAVNEAEQLPGASGAEKLEHVQVIMRDTVKLTNAIGKTNIDTKELDHSVDDAVSKVIEVVKVVHPPVE